MTHPLILVTGATGTVGSEVVKQLVEARQKVRVLVHDPAKASHFSNVVEVVVGDLAKPETLDAAFAGVDKAFVLSPARPDLPTLEANAYNAAQKAGLRHIVRLSGKGADYDFMAATPLVQWHNESEQRLRALGIAWTILQPGPFASNVLMWGIKQQGALFLPTGSGKDTPIDPQDIAAVAVTALTMPGHEGKVYELTGPELLSDAEVVHKIAAVLGKPLRFVDVPEAAAREGMLKSGVPEPLVDSYLVYFAGVKAGRMYVTSTVADVLGRPARTFDEWLHDHAAQLQ